jgi:hypothetical protein
LTQNLEVSGSIGEAQRRFLGQFLDAALALRQKIQQLQTVRVR